MKEKAYKKPIAEIIETLHTTDLLVVSGGDAKRTGYGSSEKQNWYEGEESNQSNLWNEEEL